MPRDGLVHLCAGDGTCETVTLAELLPRSFGPEHLPA
jgi:cytidine deaminase